MGPNPSGSTVPNSGAPPRFRLTYGEILEDGTVADVVAEDDELLLCRWDGKQVVVLPYVDLGSVVYGPPKVAPSVRHAVRFPSAPVEYGSVRTLFQGTATMFER
ncbi:MAG TPA: hypothetical protein VK466_08120, partial [Terriglobales bacterium]|nr:hypothetical protein [Terriglobales bacterium]